MICFMALNALEGPSELLISGLNTKMLPALLFAKESTIALTNVSFFPSMATFYFLLPSRVIPMPVGVKRPPGKGRGSRWSSRGNAQQALLEKLCSAHPACWEGRRWKVGCQLQLNSF